MADESTSERVLRLRADVDAGVQQLSKLVGQLAEETGFADKNVNGLSRSLAKFEGAARSASSIRSPASNWTPEFQKARTELDALNKQYQQFRQQSAAGIHVFADPTQGLTSADRTRLLGLNDAANANVVSVIRQQEAAYQAASGSATAYAANLPRLRYALYDVAFAAGATSAAITAVGAGALSSFASFESAFTNVQRTIDPTYRGVEQLRQQLLQMAKEIPLSFQDLSAIATLGNQLGIEASGIAQFTRTIAQFSAVSGISAEESAKSFGTLGTILGFNANQYNNFASAVELVGRTSAATDADILSMTKDIGQQAHQAGFTAAQVVGLAGAMSQLRIAPERARGSLTQYFSTLNQAVASGGQDLQNFAKITGLTAQSLSQMVRSGQGVEVFQRFLAGLSNQGDVVGVTQALDALGLSQLRVSDSFQRLASNQQVFAQYAALSTQGYAQGTELARQYAFVIDDLASRWKIFLNALAEFSAAVGAQVAPAAVNVMNILADLLGHLTEFANSPIGGAILRIAATFGVFVAIAGAVVAGGALMAGSLLAVRTALDMIGGSGVIGFFRSLIGVMTGAEGAALSLRGALIGLGRATIILGVLQLGAELIFNFGGAMQWLQGPVNFLIDAASQAALAVNGLLASIYNFLSAIPGGGIFGDLAKGQESTMAGIRKATADMHNGWNNWVASVKPATAATNDFSDAGANAGNALGDLGKYANIGAGGLGNVGDSAKKAQKEVRTLVDYANDLKGVFDRAFDLRFGSQQGLDAITKGWRDVADATRQAKQDIADYQAKLAQLTADRSTKQYQLGVAIKYGDFKRAAELRADLADNNNDITKTQEDLRKAQDAASKSLTGNSDAAIKNRGTLLGLVGTYQDLIQKYASSGMSQADLKRKTDQLKQSFVQQATQLGFNRNEVQKYVRSFDDIATIISRVPRNVTVTANANPALQALAEFEDKAKAAAANAQKALSGVSFPPPKVDGGKWQRMVNLQGQISRANSVYQRYIASGSDNKAAAQLAYIRSLTNKLSSGNYWTGGYTGGGGKYDPAGIVHKNEYVMNSSTVNRFGVGFLDMIQKGKLPFAFAPSGATGSVVNLSPIDRALIQRVGDLIAAQPGLGAGTLVGAVNAGNSFANSLGGY